MVATHVPDTVLTNEQLAAEFPSWSADKILEKTGIRQRRIAAPGETALDLAVAAAEQLFAKDAQVRDAVDFVILCTQAPDYVLPSSACILQERLSLRKGIGALDVNLGCSGFVYGLALAAGLISAGAASNVLLVTADTYSKYINDRDKSVRTLFGDGAAATLICADDDGRTGLGPFTFGTDGSGADRLIVPAGGFRRPSDSDSAIEAEDRSGNVRSANNLFMDGAAVMNFTLREVPAMYRGLLDKAGLEESDLSAVILHQANKFMLDSLQKKMKIAEEKLPRRYELIGNTVSSTIPFVLDQEIESGRLKRGSRIALLGFGVGLSWAGAIVSF
ncbi:3-oxoacyl-ACP synthase III family protein [Sphingomonas sp. Ag1]|jgi:3-oxoacyl-[acyl-carrier-protein] synthase-3|uniref:3-oxoacyl-ACP synthase III family protein n=1 Tax=Sphingomonas sp. Ag1 TaxID=1642949 RepID=UPI000A8B1960|nr:ketoacyl-ACP synthase III [Sphingomonas sp. Ag1]